jgi:hypothetical protein
VSEGVLQNVPVRASRHVAAAQETDDGVGVDEHKCAGAKA